MADVVREQVREGEPARDKGASYRVVSHHPWTGVLGAKEGWSETWG